MTQTGLSPLDPTSYSRPEQAIVTDVFLSLTVNFSKKIFHGSVTLTAKKVDLNTKEIILDAKDLNITDIYEAETNEKLNFNLSEPTEQFGSKLTIELPEKESNNYSLLINYSTSPNASGLQWLQPEQTMGKVHPFVFSQLQPIHARSFLPCQDTPGVKTKYSAVITAPSDLTVLMSAKGDDCHKMPSCTLYHFVQEVPVPSYLIAIAIGALKSKEIGPRSHVWAEEEQLEASAYEFSDTEAQLKAAEDICGPYVWGIYDLLVLPPSFPFGGMENPCLTFVTPTLLAGDKSLANVVAHEIAHSWTGNLVTNRNFEHFWLNEGFTVFLERKILGHLVGKEEQDFHAYSGTLHLKDEIARLGKDHPYKQLVVNLKGKDPDDAYSIVPYEKGQTFLRYLETVVGGPEKFEPFMRSYFDTYKYKSIDSDVFKKYFTNYFSSTPEITQINWSKWLYEPGLPPVIPEYDMTLVTACKNFKMKWLNWDENCGSVPFTLEEFNNFSISQVIHILQEIIDDEPQSVKKLQLTENVLHLDTKKNAEIKSRWIRIGLRAHWEDKIEEALKFVNEFGRMKYVRPIYRDLYDWEASRAKAIENFKKHEGFYMKVAAIGLRKDLHLIE